MIGSEQLRVSSEASTLDSVAEPRAAASSSPIPLIAWAMAASTYHRIWLGEGVLIAINVSILLYRAVGLGELIAGTIVSVLTLGVMYAFNDAYDAAADRHNPKKDQRQVSVYFDHRRACYRILLAAKILTVVLAWVLLGPASATATATVIAVNFIYSTALKGVPIVDVAWCGVWGAAFAAVVLPPTDLIVLVGLMTAVCHLYQALGDRSADAQTSPLDRLSDRELEIFRRVGRGENVQSIAESLYLSPKTVEAHKEHIKQKLKLKTNNELLQYAIEARVNDAL